MYVTPRFDKNGNSPGDFYSQHFHLRCDIEIPIDTRVLDTCRIGFASQSKDKKATKSLPLAERETERSSFASLSENPVLRCLTMYISMFACHRTIHSQNDY